MELATRRPSTSCCEVKSLLTTALNSERIWLAVSGTAWADPAAMIAIAAAPPKRTIAERWNRDGDIRPPGRGNAARELRAKAGRGLPQGLAAPDALASSLPS